MTTHSEMKQVDAVSRDTDWHSTDWQKVNNIVRLATSANCQGNTRKEMGTMERRKAESSHPFSQTPD